MKAKITKLATFENDEGNSYTELTAEARDAGKSILIIDLTLFDKQMQKPLRVGEQLEVSISRTFGYPTLDGRIKTESLTIC